MKLKIVTSAITVIALSAFTTTFAEKDIIGQWKLDADSVDHFTRHIIAKVTETNPTAASSLEEHKGEIVDMVKSIKLNFKADNTYESASSQGTKTGKWKLLNNAKTLEITKSDGTARKDSILELSATRMKLINRELKDTSLYIRP